MTATPNIFVVAGENRQTTSPMIVQSEDYPGVAREILSYKYFILLGKLFCWLYNMLER
jgi:hypothetical protein